MDDSVVTLNVKEKKKCSMRSAIFCTRRPPVNFRYLACCCQRYVVGSTLGPVLLAAEYEIRLCTWLWLPVELQVIIITAPLNNCVALEC